MTGKIIARKQENGEVIRFQELSSSNRWGTEYRTYLIMNGPDAGREITVSWWSSCDGGCAGGGQRMGDRASSWGGCTCGGGVRDNDVPLYNI